jgi:hypothetical protein
MNFKNIARAATICLAGIGLSAQSGHANFAEGQVWEYKARPQDQGSLLKIQRITQIDGQEAYHLSIIGIRFKAPNLGGVLPHIPVSQTTLEASVTRLAASSAAFPTIPVEDGIQQWRNDRGGIFTIPISEIVELADYQTSQLQQ